MIETREDKLEWALRAIIGEVLDYNGCLEGKLDFLNSAGLSSANRSQTVLITMAISVDTKAALEEADPDGDLDIVDLVESVLDDTDWCEAWVATVEQVDGPARKVAEAAGRHEHAGAVGDRWLSFGTIDAIMEQFGESTPRPIVVEDWTPINTTVKIGDRFRVRSVPMTVTRVTDQSVYYKIDSDTAEHQRGSTIVRRDILSGTWTRIPHGEV